jgi:hypothetical protein
MSSPSVPPNLQYCSTELAAEADLQVTVEGTILPLHSAILANASSVLHTALCSSELNAGANPAARSAAVQRAFGGSSVNDVAAFLRLLYDPACILDTTDYPAVASSAAWEGILRLADKLDAQWVMKVSLPGKLTQLHMVACHGHFSDPSPQLDVTRFRVMRLQLCNDRISRLVPGQADWSAWLCLADSIKLQDMTARAIPEVLKMMLKSPEQARQVLAAIDSASVSSWKLLTATLLTAVHRTHLTDEDGLDVCVPGVVAKEMPSLRSGNAPGDVLQANFRSVIFI